MLRIMKACMPSYDFLRNLLWTLIDRLRKPSLTRRDEHRDSPEGQREQRQINFRNTQNSGVKSNFRHL